MKPPKIVAELTINHLGMKKIAQVTMKRCKEAGADYVKLKIKDTKKYYSKADKSINGYDFLKYRTSLELSRQDFAEIDAWCHEIGLRWFATCHDLESLKFVASFDVPFFKVASMDSRNLDFVRKVAEQNEARKPMIVSVGGESLKHVGEIVEIVSGRGIELTLLHTVSIYPTPIDKCNIKFIQKLRSEFESPKVSIGYSGHEEGWVPTLLAVLSGASMIERHVALTRNLRIHHIRSALTLDEFKKMVDDVQRVSMMMSSEQVEYFEEELKFLRDMHYE